MPDDTAVFTVMEQARDTKEYIIPYTPSEHLRQMSEPNVVYLRILDEGTLAGFFILVLDPDGKSIEFRRVVVPPKRRGIGQLAIEVMENFCRTEFERSRIWLDVFERNHRGCHIYEKFGYEKYDESDYDGECLLLYQKQL